MADADEPSAAPADVFVADVSAKLYERWQEPAPENLGPDQLERRRLASAIRDVMERLIATGAPTPLVAEAADELERIAARFADVPHAPEYEGYRETAISGHDPQASYEFSPFIGRANALAPPISLRPDGDVVRGTVTFGSAYEGPPGCVHGGYVAGAFDELLGATQSLSGAPGMTGTLRVVYRSPTPLHRPLEMAGWIREINGRKIFTEGTLHADGELRAEAEGIFISIDPAVFRALVESRSAL